MVLLQWKWNPRPITTAVKQNVFFWYLPMTNVGTSYRTPEIVRRTIPFYSTMKYWPSTPFFINPGTQTRNIDRQPKNPSLPVYEAVGRDPCSYYRNRYESIPNCCPQGSCAFLLLSNLLHNPTAGGILCSHAVWFLLQSHGAGDSLGLGRSVFASFPQCNWPSSAELCIFPSLQSQGGGDSWLITLFTQSNNLQ